MSLTFELNITKSQLDHGGEFTLNVDNTFIKVFIPPHSYEDQLFIFFHNNKKIRVITTTIDQTSLQNCWIEYSTYIQLLNDYKALKTRYDLLVQNSNEIESSSESYNYEHSSQNYEHSYI